MLRLFCGLLFTLGPTLAPPLAATFAPTRPGPAQLGTPAEEAARAWREDLRFLARELELRHENLYHTLAPEDFAARLAALETKLPYLKRHEVVVELEKLVAAVGDGQTNIYPACDPKVGFCTLPVAFGLFGDELYVRSANVSQRSLLGARVLRIGERDAAAAYRAASDLVGCDNEQDARYWVPYLLGMPEVLHALRITATLEGIPLVLASAEGERTVVLHPFGPVPIASDDNATLFDRRAGWIDVRHLSGRPEPTWLCGAGQAFRLEHLGNLLYVQINTIGDMPDETLAAFAERMKDEIAETRPDKVAIDLRLCRSGDGELSTPLVRALIQSESIDRPGRLFAIIGPATFSAAQMLVDALERYTNVTFVGEPTGSKGNHYGDARRIVLPNSGITVCASARYWQEWHPADGREATAPDLPAPLTFEAYRNNDDPALAVIEGFVPQEPAR